MKICRIKFEILEDVVTKLMARLNFSNIKTQGQENEILERFILDYLISQVRIAKDEGFEITVADK